MPYVCYVDEAGNMETLATPNHQAQPVVVIAGLFLEQKHLIPLTKDFIRIKQNFYPKLLNNLQHDLEGLRIEIKGSDLRRQVREHVAKGELKALRYRLRYVRAVLSLAIQYGAKFGASIIVKKIGAPLKHDAVYTTSVQHLCEDFHRLLVQKSDFGYVIADFRDPGQNNIVSHAVGTQKFKVSGDALPRILEAPTFAISHNHAALQITDLLCSTLLFPIATHSYCSGYVQNLHVRAEDARIKQEFCKELAALQYSYRYLVGPKGKKKARTHWGVHVNDGLVTPSRGAWHIFN